MLYRCKKIDSVLDIDGKLEEGCWSKAEKIALVENVTGNESRNNTVVRALWNDEYLYISFECDDDHKVATMTEYNDKLYEEDVVEVFIDEDNDLKTYIEIEVNPLNALLHYYIINDLKGNIDGYAKVKKDIITAVQYDEKNNKWTTEIAIPFKEFIKCKDNAPGLGDTWKINFYRIDRKAEGDEYSAWIPTGKINFHMPKFFGEFMFVE